MSESPVEWAERFGRESRAMGIEPMTLIEAYVRMCRKQDEGVPRMPDGVGICDGCGLEFDWSELQDMDGLWCPDCQEVPDDA